MRKKRMIIIAVIIYVILSACAIPYIISRQTASHKLSSATDIINEKAIEYLIAETSDKYGADMHYSVKKDIYKEFIEEVDATNKLSKDNYEIPYNYIDVNIKIVNGKLFNKIVDEYTVHFQKNGRDYIIIGYEKITDS